MTLNPHRGGMVTFLCIAGILMLSMDMVQGDYHVGFVISKFSHPSNTLSNNSCCNPTCSECGVTLRLCFRDSGHSQSDSDSDCPLYQQNRNSPSMFYAFGTDHSPAEGAYPGEFQIYVRVSHSGDQRNVDFDPPFTNPHIDDIFIEASVPAVSYKNRNSPVTEMYEVEGIHGKATIELRVNVHCAKGYGGPDCNKVCSETEEGQDACSQEEGLDSGSDEEDSVVPVAVGSTIGAFVIVALLVIGIVVAIALKRSKYRIWKPKYKWHPASAQSETNLYTTDDAIENPSYSSSS